MFCECCGEQMEGNGYTTPYHCPNAAPGEWEYDPPDANPVYCTEEDWVEE